MPDLRVKEVQQWLNDTYPKYFKYDEDSSKCGTYPVKPDGNTGTKTVKALVMAVQIHYNLTPVDGVWGNATSAACAQIKEGLTDSTIIRIAQGGFYCKGYAPGGFDGIFGNNLAKAIEKFKKDLGITVSKVLEPEVFKSLLTTDPTVLVNEDKKMVRIVQQYLNGNYYNLFKAKLGYIPTGGIYERKTNKALIYAFQKEIGTTADGAIGTNTFKAMPEIEKGCSKTAIVKILQAALICNGYIVDELNGVYDSTLETKVSAFQQFMCLDNDPIVELGKVNRRTWGALLLSKGDFVRPANAGDCWQRLNAVKAKSLYDAGYRYIGRYLTKVQGGLDKNLTAEEITSVTSAGLKIFPIFQESNNAIGDFNYVSGYLNGYDAIMAATQLLIPSETTIYFAVDFDALEEQVKDEITEYFRGINKAKEDLNAAYGVGIYSARNTCSIICERGLATSSFVSDMSTGYSGNLGFLMPDNWAYDQYASKKITASDGSTFDLDQVMASGKAKYFNQGEFDENDFWDAHKYNIRLDALQSYSNHAESISTVLPLIEELENAYWEYNPQGKTQDCILAVLYYLWRDKYGIDSADGSQFSVTLKTDGVFVARVNANDQYAELKTKISNYITGAYTYLKDEDSVTEADVNNMEYTFSRMIELPHLAVIISAYLHHTLEGFIKKEWYGWAGDLATGIKEVNILAENNLNATAIEHARDRIGKMEVLADNPYNLAPTNEVQMNYCDVIADMDAIGIVTLIERKKVQNENDKHILSSAMRLYYEGFYKKRCAYWLNEVKPSEYSIEGVTKALVSYINASEQSQLRERKMGEAEPESIEASCRSLAEFIMHDRKTY